MKLSRFLFLCCPFLLLFLLGCSSGAPKARLKGKVRLDNQPFIGTVLVATKDSLGNPIDAANTDKDGAYELQNTPPGPVVLYVRPITIGGMPQGPGVKPPQFPQGAQTPADWGPDFPPPPGVPPWVKPAMLSQANESNKVDTKYRSAATSGFEVELKDGENPDKDLELKSGDMAPPR
jgi:hypothetical protein